LFTFFFLPSLLATENLQNQFFFKKLILISLFGEISTAEKKKKKAEQQGLWTWPQEKKKVTEEGRH
jgi:hypothetical protein